MLGLTLLLAFQQALWIDVPFIRQDKNGCGSAVIGMIMQYWQPEATVDVDRIQQLLYSKTAGGIYAKDMAGYLEQRGYRVFTFHGEWQDLEEHLSKGRPLIVSLERNRRGVPLHYVVVAGLDNVANLVLLNDPAGRKLLSMEREEFERSWRSTENWTLLAVPQLDLASRAFRDDRLTEARSYLDDALQANPSDPYTNEFLGTVYFLENNTEAAIEYWNRAGKPEIENIRFDPPLHTNPVLVDRAFTFSRGSTMTVADYRTTQAKLSGLGVFSRVRMDLAPAGDDPQRFDVTVRAAERSSIDLWSWASGLPYQSITPSFFNIGGNGKNVTSLLRWDPNKRRAAAQLQMPLNRNPSFAFRLGFDARDENWTSTSGDFHLSKTLVSAEIHALPSALWNWTSGAEISQRRFSNDFSGGAQLKYSGSVTRSLWRNPARHAEAAAAVAFEAGKLWSTTPSRFAKVTATTRLRWGALDSAVRVGVAGGPLPFDERFVVGFERDSDLWLRAHSATIEGRKNASNASRSFVLLTTGFQRPLLRSAWFSVSSGPFVDSGRRAGFPRWTTDAGLEMRFRILDAFGVNLSYARSLSDSRHNFFLSQPGM